MVGIDVLQRAEPVAVAEMAVDLAGIALIGGDAAIEEIQVAAPDGVEIAGLRLLGGRADPAGIDDLAEAPAMLAPLAAAVDQHPLAGFDVPAIAAMHLAGAEIGERPGRLAQQRIEQRALAG